ncbi:MAG: serine hydrolase domain-containing protein [Bacteroidota bacterium]|jgi:CubicO group peptidase (beta-lactamase class C family)
MKILKFILKAIALIALLITLFIFVSGKTYLFKTLAYNFVGIDDLDLFETRTVKTSNPIEWPTSINYNKRPISEKLETTLKKYESIAFLVLKNDSVLNEYYWDGYNDSSLTNSFSMAKSFISVLTGIALKDGKIKSLDQKVGDFIPEFKNGNRSKLTIRHLLTMSAALSWEESYTNPLGPTTEAYYGDDLNGLILKQDVVDEPGKKFKYQSGVSQLLAMVVENATGEKVADYASKKLWQPLNAVHDAQWSLDKKEGTEKAYCCFYSNARDFARIGSLYLHKGNWKGTQIVDTNYVLESVTPYPLDNNGKPNEIYGYQWWAGNYSGKQVFYCRGILGQYICVIPDENIVFVRLGRKRGEKNADGTLTDLPLYVEEVLKWTK